jgi:hypothetical protein
MARKPYSKKNIDSCYIQKKTKTPKHILKSLKKAFLKKAFVVQELQSHSATNVTDTLENNYYGVESYSNNEGFYDFKENKAHRTHAYNLEREETFKSTHKKVIEEYIHKFLCNKEDSKSITFDYCKMDSHKKNWNVVTLICMDGI